MILDRRAGEVSAPMCSCELRREGSEGYVAGNSLQSGTGSQEGLPGHIFLFSRAHMRAGAAAPALDTLPAIIVQGAAHIRYAILGAHGQFSHLGHQPSGVN